MITYLKIISEETPFVLRCPDEVTYTLEEEQEILARLLKNKESIMMLAEVEGKVAIGTAMIEYLTKLAKEIGCEQIELEVVDGTYRDELIMCKVW